MIRIGVAQIDITPSEPVWLVGYGDRDHRSEGTYQSLRAGALTPKRTRLAGASYRLGALKLAHRPCRRYGEGHRPQVCAVIPTGGVAALG